MVFFAEVSPLFCALNCLLSAFTSLPFACQLPITCFFCSCSQIGRLQLEVSQIEKWPTCPPRNFRGIERWPQSRLADELHWRQTQYLLNLHAEAEPFGPIHWIDLKKQNTTKHIIMLTNLHKAGIIKKIKLGHSNWPMVCERNTFQRQTANLRVLLAIYSSNCSCQKHLWPRSVTEGPQTCCHRRCIF